MRPTELSPGVDVIKTKVFDPRYDVYGTKIPPVHKPARRRNCEWVPSLGWVFNPTGKRWSDDGVSR